MPTVNQWIILAVQLIPMLVLIAIVWATVWVRKFRKERPPVAEKMLRPAGESLRLEVEQLDDQLGTDAALTLLTPGTAAGIFMVGNPVKSAFTVVVIILLGVAFFVIQTWRILRLLVRRRNARLGFACERAVAEELNQLMLQGCHIYHDVPMEPYGNLDHVIVARSGVYAVETKGRRKRKSTSGKKDYEVVFDGETLTFPDGTDTKAIQQARQQADRLQVFLSKAVGEPVKVNAILTFPGWFVTTRRKADLKVLNPKNIKSVVLDSKLPQLVTAELRTRIIHQLDQKCRDVTF